jgi:hypothetical protein
MSNRHSRSDQPTLAIESVRNDREEQQQASNPEPIDRLLQLIQEVGGTVKRSGAGWICTCPAHSDQNPSLSVDVGDDDRVLLHCHAGCSVQSIVSSLGLPMSALFPRDSSSCFLPKQRHGVTVTAQKEQDDARTNAPGYASADDAIRAMTNQSGTPDDSWTYSDPEGNPVGMVLRWDHERGKVIRPISLIDGRWQCHGMPVPRLLYKLDELLDADGPVIVCEGEKACEAARVCGFIATTSAHGSQSPHKSDWSPIADQDLIIIPDLDDAGEQYAQLVKELCEAAGARSIRILDLRQHWPQLGSGDDLADVLDLESGDADAVRDGVNELIERTQPERYQHTRVHQQSEKGSTSLYRPFPIDALPSPLDAYCREGADAIGCDPAYIVLPMLSMLAGAIGNSYKVRVKNSWDEPCIAWTCIVGNSGTAKSPAIELALKPLMDIQESCMLEHKLAMRDRAQTNEDGKEAPKLARQIIDDATIEAVLQLLQDNERGLLLRTDELSGWFDFDRYQSKNGISNTSRWLEMFHGRPVWVDRRTKETLYVARASLSITGSIQPGVLRRVLSTRNIENGLAARFLFAMPPHRSKVWSDEDISEHTFSEMRAVVERLNALPMNTSTEHPCPNELRFSLSARNRFIRFANEHNASMELEDEQIRASFSKIESYVPRFAMIMHLVRVFTSDKGISESSEIDTESIQIAIRIAEWFKQESRRVYAMLATREQDQHQQDLIGWILRNGGSTTVRELSRGPARYKGKGSAQAALDELANAGHGSWRARKPNGRTMEFVLYEQSQSRPGPIDTSDSDTSAVDMSRNAENVTGASRQYPVPSTRKDI